MGLLIHDLSPEGWAKVSREYDGWDIVSDNESIRPCVGCFSCWNRDPGRCAIKDGYEKRICPDWSESLRTRLQ